jgi:3'-5' exoribonuclease 1
MTRYIIVDLEATCWEREAGMEQREIIEIGAACLESGAGPVSSEFDAFVRPVISPQLSDFCVQLTSIQQTDVDSADDFREVFPRFVDWIGPESFVLCAWGGYDLQQFRIDCRRHGVTLPASFENYINLKQEFTRQKGIKPRGMTSALKAMNIPLEGRHHRAIDDVRNIVKLARIILPQREQQAAQQE